MMSVCQVQNCRRRGPGGETDGSSFMPPTNSLIGLPTYGRFGFLRRCRPSVSPPAADGPEGGDSGALDGTAVVHLMKRLDLERRGSSFSEIAMHDDEVQKERRFACHGDTRVRQGSCGGSSGSGFLGVTHPCNFESKINDGSDWGTYGTDYSTDEDDAEFSSVNPGAGLEFSSYSQNSGSFPCGTESFVSSPNDDHVTIMEGGWDDPIGSTPTPRAGLRSTQNRTLFPKNGSVDAEAAHNRRVSFTSIEVRDYTVVLGDHPSCSCGPPVSLGWEYRSAIKVDIDEYELTRGRRRTVREMTMDYSTRKNLLMETGGYTETEIRKVERRMTRVKTQKSLVDLFKMHHVNDADV